MYLIAFIVLIILFIIYNNSDSSVEPFLMTATMSKAIPNIDNSFDNNSPPMDVLHQLSGPYSRQGLLPFYNSTRDNKNPIFDMNVMNDVSGALRPYDYGFSPGINPLASLPPIGYREIY